DLYLRNGQDKEALATIQPLRDHPSDAVSVRIASLELRQNQVAAAMRRADDVLSREPTNQNALLVKAQALLASGKLAEALIASRATVDAAPSWSDAHVVLGRALLAIGDQESAFNQFAEGIRLDPGSVELPAQLAQLALATGRERVALDFA